MEDNKIVSYEIPKGVLTRMRIAHIGKILFNLSIPAFILAGIGLMSPLIYGLSVLLYYGVLIIATIISLGTLLVNSTFISLWEFTDFSGLLETFLLISTNLMYAVVGATLLSAIFMLIDNKKSIPRIVISYVIFAISLIISLVLILGGASWTT